MRWCVGEGNSRAGIDRNWERLPYKMKWLLALEEPHLSAGPGLPMVADSKYGTLPL